MMGKQGRCLNFQISNSCIFDQKVSSSFKQPVVSVLHMYSIQKCPLLLNTDPTTVEPTQQIINLSSAKTVMSTSKRNVKCSNI